MIIFNLSSYNSGPFLLVGIPGLEQFHVWIGIPFCAIYIVALVGNCILLSLIAVERSLHEPMFFFLSMLATTDLILSTAGMPKTLSIFWRGGQEITFAGCLTQMFFIHYSFVLDSAILMSMAFDRYVAICSPLRYTSILTPKSITKIVVAICFRSFCIILPVVFLLTRLPFCRTHIIPHTYCEHIGVARLACADISINIWYGFCVPIMTVLSDVILIAISYIFILCAVFHLPSREARQKALGTCGSHVCVILMFYIPGFFTILAHRFGHDVSRSFHIMFANLYIVIPPALNPIVYGVKTKQIRDKVMLSLASVWKSPSEPSTAASEPNTAVSGPPQARGAPRPLLQWTFKHALRSHILLEIHIKEPIKKEPEKPIDQEKTCLLLLWVFTINNGGHHWMNEFSHGNVPSSELQSYTWMDATFKELTS
ncbi:olfactory receptor 52H1-like [Choloepus didactylus]|uniref:olfactory receptor 52H1-like n=1 Tax=Choloepus didactylus TaxID=27675 RepID=UPI00189FBBA5|nr:olfactory receptor 52H1-like [Choloepus didactylus]